jgi:hypothetical protein
VDPPPLQGAVDGGGTGGEEGQGRGGGAMSWAGQASAVTRQKGREEQGGMAGLGAQLNVSSEKLRCSPVLDDKSLAPPVYSQARYVCACFVCVCVCVCVYKLCCHMVKTRSKGEQRDLLHSLLLVELCTAYMHVDMPPCSKRLHTYTTYF